MVAAVGSTSTAGRTNLGMGGKITCITRMSVCPHIGRSVKFARADAAIRRTYGRTDRGQLRALGSRVFYLLANRKIVVDPFPVICDLSVEVVGQEQCSTPTCRGRRRFDPDSVRREPFRWCTTRTGCPIRAI